MSDTAERPASDPDAWATACAEDLATEKARRRGSQGPPPGSAAEELRKLMDALTDRLGDLQSVAAPLLGPTARGVAQEMMEQAVRQARAAVEPLVAGAERRPDVLDHLAAAGSELLAAYRSVVSAQEQKWTGARPGEARPGTPRPGSDGGSGTDGRPGIRDADDRADGVQDASRDTSSAGPTARHQDSREGDTDGGGPEPGEHIDLD